MPTSSRWVVATGNNGKLAEIRLLLAGSGLILVSQAELGIAGAAETGTSFIENALIKARHASRVAGLPALADDSGLAVDALGGAPGIYSARYAGAAATPEANVAKLLAALVDVPMPRRTACFHCVVVAVTHAEDPTPLVFDGRWEGVIAEQPGGDGGFGYDPVFIDPICGCRAAELPAATKNEISHRAIAMRKLAQHLRKRARQGLTERISSPES